MSPYEQQRVIPDGLVATQMGGDMLSQDYILKRLAASLTFPESKAGKAYWREMPKDAAENNFSRVWIVPDKSVVYAGGDKAYVGEASLKAVCEESRAFKANILPLIDKEVNEGSNFVRLRQIYRSLVLAAWFKKHLKENIVNKLYSDKNKIAGIDTASADIKDKVYNAYIESCKQGVYNYTKTETPRGGNAATGSSFARNVRVRLRRHYFSGGVALGSVDPVIKSLAAASGKTLESGTSVTAVLQKLTVLAVTAALGLNASSCAKDTHSAKTDIIRDAGAGGVVIKPNPVAVPAPVRSFKLPRDRGNVIGPDVINPYVCSFSKLLIEKAGLDWKEVSDKLVENGLAERIAPPLISLKRDPYSCKSKLLELFGDDFSRLWPVLQQANQVRSGFTKAIEDGVKTLDVYHDKTGEDFASMVFSWKDAAGQPVLITWKAELDAARQQYGQDKERLAKVEARVIKELVVRTEAELEYSRSGFGLATMVKHKVADCVGFLQVEYLLGNFLGLSFAGLNAKKLWDSSPMTSGLEHVAIIFALSDGMMVMTNGNNVVSAPFDFDKTFTRHGDYWRLSRGVDPGDLHQTIRLLDRKGIIAALCVNIGSAFTRQHDYKNAIEFLEKAIEFDPGVVSAHISLGNAYGGQRDYANAIIEFERAIELDNDYVAAHNNLGVVYLRQRKYRLAITHLSRAIELDRDFADAYENLGFVYQGRREPGDRARAKECFAKAAELKKQAAAKPLVLNNKRQGLFYRSGTKTKPILATNRSLLEAHREDFRDVLPQGEISVGRMQRFTDGHETLHALKDMLSAYDYEVATIDNDTEEEPLANVLGVAFADGYVMIPESLNRAVAILERALNKKLGNDGKSQISLSEYIQGLDYYDSANPKALEELLKGIGVDVVVVDLTPEQLADVGGIDYRGKLNIQEKGIGIVIDDEVNSSSFDSAAFAGFKVEIVSFKRDCSATSKPHSIR